MKRWHSLFDGMSASLKYYLVLTILFGVIRSLAIPIISSIVRFESPDALRFLEILRITLVFLLQLFPFVVLVSLAQRKLKHSGAVVASIISGIIIYALTLLTPLSNLSNQYGFTLFNLSLPSSSYVSQPVQLGFMLTLLSYQIVKFSIRISRRNIPYGFVGFIDNDTWVILYTIIFSLIVGYGVVLGWPWVIMGLEAIMKFIAQDITNPVNLFIYGILEHTLILFNLQSILHANFWFSTMGGSWINPSGTLILGDVNIWIEQLINNIIPVGFGRFISGWYIVNMFIIPGMLWGIYLQFSDKFDTRRYRNMFFLLTLVSILLGFRLPFELFLVLTAPLLYMFYILFTAIIYAIVSALGINVGPIINAGITYVLPGNGVHALLYLRNPLLSERVWQLFIVGFVSLVLMSLITHIYYKYLAIDFIGVGNKQKSVEAILLAMGGLDNIKIIHSSFSRIYVLPYDKSKVDFDRVNIFGVSRIIENKNGYSLNFGGASGIVRKAIMKLLIEMKLKELENKSNES
ncbi:MAG: PTS transporter subunit EIIC [Erysipelotrichia bacterium]|jgi:phosphotransferase system  glucose/maltose/N-acetylglucosamine-specific IIC component|nr:PTS transporter subunit EIIC [Erysipelotrichia bacterium]